MPGCTSAGSQSERCQPPWGLPALVFLQPPLLCGAVEWGLLSPTLPCLAVARNHPFSPQICLHSPLHARRQEPRHTWPKPQAPVTGSPPWLGMGPALPEPLVLVVLPAPVLCSPCSAPRCWGRRPHAGQPLSPAVPKAGGCSLQTPPVSP